jgi:hypothetical protein
MEENKKRQEPNQERHEDGTLGEQMTGNVTGNSTSVGNASRLDEKSSTMSRRNKSTGLSTKDGLTGSDLDGQVS